MPHPILCNIFLAQIDQALKRVFSPVLVLKVFRYVDNFLIVSKQGSVTQPDLVKCVLDDFKRLGNGPTFTHELRHDDAIQFLDLNIKVLQGHVCWSFSPHSRKELLPYDSAHSKLVKRAIASLCLESALRKSCAHMMQSSFEHQVERLLSAGFPVSVVNAVAETLLQKVQGSKPRTKAQLTNDQRPEVVPYLHKVSHNLKKVTTR